MKLAIAMCVVVLTCMAQSTAPKPLPPSTSASAPRPPAAAKPGVISGRLFAITAGGDIKPARFAQVYLLDGAAILKAWYDQLHISRSDYLTQLKNPEEFTKGQLGVENDEDSTSVLAAAAPKERERLRALAVADIDAKLALIKEMANIRRALVENAAKALNSVSCLLLQMKLPKWSDLLYVCNQGALTRTAFPVPPCRRLRTPRAE